MVRVLDYLERQFIDGAQADAQRQVSAKKVERDARSLAAAVHKLRRAASFAQRAKGAMAAMATADLLLVAGLIERDGLSGPLFANLRALVGATVAIETESGRPTAKWFAGAIDLLSKPSGGVSVFTPHQVAQQWLAKTQWKRKHITPRSWLRTDG